jgi:hypothetical protein
MKVLRAALPVNENRAITDDLLVSQRFHRVQLRSPHRRNQPADHAHKQQDESRDGKRHHRNSQMNVASSRVILK